MRGAVELNGDGSDAEGEVGFGGGCCLGEERDAGHDGVGGGESAEFEEGRAGGSWVCALARCCCPIFTSILLRVAAG